MSIRDNQTLVRAIYLTIQREQTVLMEHMATLEKYQIICIKRIYNKIKQQILHKLINAYHIQARCAGILGTKNFP